MSKHKRLANKVSIEQSVESISKDNSQWVWQRDKLREPLNIREHYRWTNRQSVILEAAADKSSQVIIIDGYWGTGKAQPLDAKILTPKGWKVMGEINIGDEVITQSGMTTKVVGVFPQGEKDIYRVTFSDGSQTECCEDHLWLTQNQYERNKRLRKRNQGNPIYRKAELLPKIRSLKEIRDDLFVSGIEGRLNHSIPMVNPIEFPKRSHYIHPYVMGSLLGDGCFFEAVTLTNIDQEILDEVSRQLPSNLKLKQISKTITYSIVNAVKRGGQNNPLKDEIARLDLYKKNSCDKFIPEDYLFDSIENRIALLRGLMDTDGTTGGQYHSYTTCSIRLRDDVIHLIESLGGTAIYIVRQPFYTYKGQKLAGKLSYTISIKLNNINPFLLSRKASAVKLRTKYFPIRYFKSIELVGKKYARCIMVEDPSHLYVTDRFIVTHNTSLAVLTALKLLNEKKTDGIVYIRNALESTSSGKVGLLPGSLEERMAPYNVILFDKLREFIPKPDIDRLKKEERLECIPVSFLQGKTFTCKTVIIDEAASMSYDDLLLAVSRIGPHCKVFIIGDSTFQLTIGARSGFKRFLDYFNDVESKEHGVYVFELKEASDILRSGLIRFIMTKTGIIPRSTQNAGSDWAPSKS